MPDKDAIIEASRPLAEALIERKPFDHSISLRGLVDARLIIDEFITEHEGELTPEIEELLRDTDNATKEKVTSIAWFVKNEDVAVDAEKALIANLQRRVKARENRITWLKSQYLMEQMQRLGLMQGDSIKGIGVTARFQLNNPKLVGEVPEDTLIDMKLDPATQAYVRYIPEAYELDRNATLSALKAAHATVDGLIAAQGVLANKASKQKDIDAAVLTINSVSHDQLKAANDLIAKFPELSVVRDLSVRIA